MTVRLIQFCPSLQLHYKVSSKHCIIKRVFDTEMNGYHCFNFTENTFLRSLDPKHATIKFSLWSIIETFPKGGASLFRGGAKILRGGAHLPTPPLKIRPWVMGEHYIFPKGLFLNEPQHLVQALCLGKPKLTCLRRTAVRFWQLKPVFYFTIQALAAPRLITLKQHFQFTSTPTTLTIFRPVSTIREAMAPRPRRHCEWVGQCPWQTDVLRPD
jgi:hypothetical protein